MKEKVIEIMKENFPNYQGEFTEGLDFINDLKADSVDIVGFVMALEDEFNLEFEDDDIINIKTLGDAIKALSEKLNA